MHILISERLRPFSLLPTSSMILPGIGYCVQISPCLIILKNVADIVACALSTVHISLNGPLSNWIVLNDLEKGCITVSGCSATGWISYRLIANQQLDAVFLIALRVPQEGLIVEHRKNKCMLQRGEYIQISGKLSRFEPYQPPHCARLFLGVTKQQDCTKIQKRMSLTEIFPLWHRLGQLLTQAQSADISTAMFALLDACRVNISSIPPEQQASTWLKLLKAGFDQFLVPRSVDSDYQGILPSPLFCELDEKKSMDSLLSLLVKGGQYIESLFIGQTFQKPQQIAILPYLWPMFASGRLLGVLLPEIGLIDIEWTKKTIRRLIFTATNDGQIKFDFRANVRSMRMRIDSKNDFNRIGKQISTQSTCDIQKGNKYFFDNFQ